eukprot:CAMPEP_0117658960 /NCGR_PEP_ID=MMETSP0804-20121206/6160_1 /TAXON_ID=1074897 /ORGANISM="Tetraselmis astigmatica, Strain CCMP880" /LENGTH=408 /DNA_ID=CAMNT_0005465551 /DNA_START=303 /DNA_END=1529 /DNA_ORIENTATION=+
MRNRLTLVAITLLCCIIGYHVMGPSKSTTVEVKVRSYGPRSTKPIPDTQIVSVPYSKQKMLDSCRGRGRVDGTQQMKVLVTGTAGFIGHGTAKALWDRGDGVVGLDNFNDYYSIPLKRARAQDLEDMGVYTVEGDLNDRELLAELFRLCKFTHVIHLAAQAGVRYAAKNPMSYVKSNLAGTVTLAEVMKEQNPIPALVFASSSSVYGLNTKTPFSEDDRVDQPASLYAATKKADEMITHTYFNIHGMSITALRFFTVYGPMGRPDMAAFSFTKAIFEGRPIDIFQGPGGSELQRDFTFIDDIVAGVIGSTDTAPPSSKATATFRIFNLGNTNPTSVSDFVAILEKHIGRTAIRNYIPVPPTGDVLATHADITKAKEAFGYTPQTNLDEGLRRFVQWYKDFYIRDKHEY